MEHIWAGLSIRLVLLELVTLQCQFIYVMLLWSLCAWWGCHASKNLLVKRLTNRSTFRWPSLPFGMDHIGMLITNKKCPPCSDLPAIFLLKLGTFFLYNKQISSTSYPQLIFLCKHLLQFATSKHTSKWLLLHHP